MYFANFASGFLFVSPYLSAKDYSVFFSLFILFIF